MDRDNASLYTIHTFRKTILDMETICRDPGSTVELLTNVTISVIFTVNSKELHYIHEGRKLSATHLRKPVQPQKSGHGYRQGWPRIPNQGSLRRAMLAGVVGDGLLLPREKTQSLIDGSMHWISRVSNGEAQGQIGQQVSAPINLLDGKDETLGHPVAPLGNSEGETSPHYYSWWGKWNKNEHSDSRDTRRNMVSTNAGTHRAQEWSSEYPKGAQRKYGDSNQMRHFRKTGEITEDTLNKEGVVALLFNTQEAKAGRSSWVGDQHGLHSQSQAARTR